MNEKSIIVGLDVGTTKVCTIVGIKSKTGIEIIGIGSHPSYGLKKGSVVNVDKTVNSIRNSVEEARLMSGLNISQATIGLAGNHIYSFNSSGVVPVKGREITKLDVERVLDAAKAVVIPPDREILHVIAQEFRVDNTSGIKDPVGMCGVRLEANVHIVTGTVSLIQNLVKCVEQAGIKVNHLTLQPIASSASVLHQEEKEMGVVLVDIGGGTTDIAIWKNGSLVHSQIIPVGGNHFTNDLAVALKVPHPEAERIKINHGSVNAERINFASQITVQGVIGTKAREVPQSLIAEILQMRAEEIFNVVRQIISEKFNEHDLTAGYVLTGGGALMSGLPELAEKLLNRPCKLGYPKPIGTMTKVMQDPKLSTVLGLLIEASENEKAQFSEDIYMAQSEDGLSHYSGSSGRENISNAPIDLIRKLSDSIKGVFKEIF